MNSLILLGRYPDSTNSKTRLASSIGADKANKIYKVCLENTLKVIESLSKDIKPIFFYDGSTPKSKVQKLIGPKITAVYPKYSDIYDHINWAIEKCLKLGSKKIVVISSDIPDLTSELVTQAFDLLDQHEIIIGPDNDQGIFLFGVKKSYPQLFEKSSSKKTVLEQTLERIKKLEINFKLLPELIDLDTKQDLEKWLNQVTNSQTKTQISQIISQ